MLSFLMALLKIVVLAASAASPQSPVAVIEEVTGGPAGVQPMDYVATGQVIELGQQDTVVIGYLRSCWHETITGGAITVGTVQSEVRGGRVERSRTPCDGGHMLLTAQLANASAGSAFRAAPVGAPPRPAFTLYGLSPVVEVSPSGTLVIERIDQPGERHEIALTADRLERGAFLDLARLGVELSPGGIYRAKAGAQQMVFQIDPSATSGQAPLIGRLIRLQPAAIAAPAAAPRSPVAVIEDVTGGPAGVQPMDYVATGQVIELGQQDTVVIGYLRSCWHETVTGGAITVGTVQSEVRGGRIERSRTPCDGGQMLLTAQFADTSAGAAFRAAPTGRPPRPEFTLYGLSPVVEVSPSGTLVIERIDQAGERHEIALTADRLERGAFLDLARLGVELSPGGIYRAKAGARQMVFQIDPNASPGRAPLIGRLMRLQPAG